MPLGLALGRLGWAMGHTCSGMGGELPGLQLLVPRTDMASPATAGPEAPEPEEPKAQASPAWISYRGCRCWGTGKEERREG